MTVEKPVKPEKSLFETQVKLNSDPTTRLPDDEKLDCNVGDGTIITETLIKFYNSL